VDLSCFLEDCGYSTWWDTELVSGDRFDDEIKKQLTEARAVIVIWTANSARSDYVLGEARQAKKDGKLIPTRIASLRPDDHLPFDLQILQADLVTDRQRILRGLEAKGVMPFGRGRTRAGSQTDPATIERAEQLAHWSAIKDSQKPAEFRKFLDKH